MVQVVGPVQCDYLKVRIPLVLNYQIKRGESADAVMIVDKI